MLSPVRDETPYRLFGLSAGDPGASSGNARLDPPSKRAPRVRTEIKVETARLVLRKYGRRDQDFLHRMVADPETFHFSHRGAMSSEESWSLLLRHLGHWQLFGYGVFAILDKTTGEFLGETGVCDFRRSLGADFDFFPEITWSIVPAAQGRGYATEAAAAALEWLEREHRRKRTVCLIHEGNAASIRVADRLGYQPFERRPYRNYTALLMAREPASDQPG